MSTLPSSCQQTLGMLVWNTCNARCAHCGPESGPKDRTTIAHEKVVDLIREASRIYDPGWCLSLSGGEIFIYYDRLREYVRLAHEGKGYSTLITNCFWATSIERAIKMLEPLMVYDLRVLGVSADQLHAKYVPYDRLRNALRAARDLGLRVHVRCVATRSSRIASVLEELQDAAPWFTNFMEMPLIPDGRGISVPLDELFLQSRLPTGKCPAASLTLNPSGRAMVCCNGAGEFPALQIGDIEHNTLAELQYAYATDPLLGVLVSEGPAALREYMDVDDRQAIENKQYVGNYIPGVLSRRVNSVPIFLPTIHGQICGEPESCHVAT